MKIKDYKTETFEMCCQFEDLIAKIKNKESLSKEENEIDLFILFDAIENRLLLEDLWTIQGLIDEDEMPETPNKLLFPKFR